MADGGCLDTEGKSNVTITTTLVEGLEEEIWLVEPSRMGLKSRRRARIRVYNKSDSPSA